jgi:hypothetical protein
LTSSTRYATVVVYFWRFTMFDKNKSFEASIDLVIKAEELFPKTAEAARRLRSLGEAALGDMEVIEVFNRLLAQEVNEAKANENLVGVSRAMRMRGEAILYQLDDIRAGYFPPPK